MVLIATLLVCLGVVLLAHMTILPLLHSRAVLWRGPELLIATLALVGAIATQAWGLAALVVPVAVVALRWRPWWVWGMTADAVVAASARSAGMVRARYEPQAHPHAALVGGAAQVRCVGVAGVATVVVATGSLSPKVKLWRNLFRKSVQNHVWRVASS